MDWENVFSSEIDEFCNKVTKYHFPDCIQYGNIKTTDFTIWRGRIDILTGGFPCQPYSQAGLRKGKDDEHHLWPEMLRTVREVQPPWVVGENVRGITNWNGGVVFDEVQADLENEGYEVLPFLLPACAVNAAHRRDRIWFIAHCTDTGIIRRNGKQSDDGGVGAGGGIHKRGRRGNDGNETFGVVTNPESSGFAEEINQWQEHEQKGGDIRYLTLSNGGKSITSYTEYERCKEQWDTGTFRSAPTVPSIKGRVESGFRGGNDGVSSRVDRIKALGNAIVPQVAFEIFKAIEQYDNLCIR